MKQIALLTILSLAAIGNTFAAFDLTASKVTIEDVTVDKNNFFVTVEAATSSGEYVVDFDVWPAKHSAIGSFSTDDKTLSYNSCKVHKTKANGSAVNMWYYPADTAEITLSIVSKGNGKCTLSGSIEAVRNNVAYTYNIAAFEFDYSEEETPEPPAEDPFRFEPATPATISFVADVVNFRKKEGYIEVTLNEMKNETYDWIDLRLLSDTLDMPAGTYAVNNSGNPGSLTASKGYLGGTKGDDPCYLAVRDKEKDNWGQYTPYYIESGSLTVSFNAKGDTIFVTGTLTSHNGSTVNVNVSSYNMLYVPEEVPPTPENRVLPIDTVVITYLSNLSDSANNKFLYTFNFSAGDDYPTVLVDAWMTKPMELVAGTYTLADKQLEGLQLAQNQDDFEANMYMGSAYDFVSASLTLKQENGKWTYSMEMGDKIGSSYRFEMSQTPHIILYPQPEPDGKDKPFAKESKTVTTQAFVADTLIWKDETVAKDGIIDIILTCKNADKNGVRPYIHLGMYSDVTNPAAGTYPINGSEQDGSFSASLGMFGDVIIPCYAAVVTNAGIASQLWFLVSGSVTIAYDEYGEKSITGEALSYFGSTIQFEYVPSTQGIEPVNAANPASETRKFIHNGMLFIERNGTLYTPSGVLYTPSCTLYTPSDTRLK